MAKLTGESTTEIDAPIDEVWAIIEDVPTAPEWQGGYRRMTAIETDAEGRATLVEVVVDGKVKDLASHQRFTYAGPTSLKWEQTKGDMKSVTGSWTLEDLGDGRTKATFALEADPGRVLGMAIRGPVEMALRALLVNPRAGELKKRAEA
ncbi:MAG: SRPBCC family protein [Solirubrobacteraceae bacterium]|nr:SRPBCC family protein [Solirubrobacteraceae bacterium]